MNDVDKALERIISNAVYGIGSNAYEIMNEVGYKQDMEQHDNDVAVVRTALENAAINQELLEALKAVIESPQVRSDLHPDRLRLAKQALAKAEGGKNVVPRSSSC